jgi:hypothetical protein
MASPWELAARAIAAGGEVAAEVAEFAAGWEDVSSGHLAAVKFEGGIVGTISVRFRNGAVHDYPGESRSTYEALRDSPSPGTYFWRNLRQASGRSGS